MFGVVRYVPAPPTLHHCGAADNGLQFTLRDQSFAGQNNGSGAQPNSAAQLVIPDADLTPVAATQIYSRAGLGSGVEIRV